MKVFGLWERLTKIIFFKNQQVTIEPAAQSSVASDKIINIPDMGSTPSQDMVLSDQAQTLKNKSLQDSTTFVVDETDATKKLQFQVSGISAGATRTITVANGNTTLQAGTMATTGGNLSQFAATTSAQLAGVISDETGTGVVVFNSSPAITSPTVSTSIVAGTASMALLDTTATTVDAFGAATTLNLGHDGASASTTSIATGNLSVGTKAVNIGTNSAAGSTTNVTIGSTAGTSSITLQGAASITGNTTITGDLAVNGGDITTSSATLTIGNTGSANQTTNIATSALASGTTKTVNIGTNGPADSITNINMGNLNGTGTTTVNNTLTVSVGATKDAVALKVTQAGSGDALFIEDEASEISVTRIDAAGNMGIGVGTSETLTDKLKIAGNLKVTGNAVIDGNLTISGTTTTVNTTELLVKDKLITLNDGGAASSGGGVGIEVEENAAVTGYAKVSSDRNKWEIKAPNSANVVTIPNITGAGDVALLAGSQTFDGAKTFSSAVTVTPTTNQLVLGVTNTTTISATAPAASATYTIPDVGTSANFVMTSGTQTIAGNKTISGITTFSGASIVTSAATTAIGPTATTSTTTNFINAATASANTKTINIGASGVSGSTTAISVGSAVAGALNTLTLNGNNAVKLPAGTDAQRPGQAGQPAAVDGMIRYNSTQNTFEGYAAGAWAGIGGGGTTDKINQAGHSFVVGDVLYLNGSTYAKAIASAANTAEVVGVVSRVIDADNFEMTLSGEVSGLSGLVAGEVYFLSATTAGLLTVTEPSVVGHVSLPVGVASSTTSLYVAPKRGVVVGAANARTTISVANNAATNVVDVTNYNSLKLEGELNVTRSSGGNQRAYYTVEAAKNGAGVWQVSASYTGDDVLYTTLPSWDVASNNLQVTMPLVTNFTSASLTYSLNAPAVGASLPLSIDSSSLNVVDSAPLSYRNRIINGGMQVCQRYAVNTNVGLGGAAYIVDRFAAREATPASANAQWSTVAPSGFTNSLAYLITATGTPTTNDIAGIEHKIEGLNVADLDWGTANAKTVTLSFWARSSVVGTYGGLATNGAETRAYGFTYSILAQDTWEYKTVTIPGDTSGTWLKDNGIGLRITWDMGSGSGKRIAGGSWGTISNFEFGVNSTVILGQTASASFYLTGVQLEVGSKASAFERRPYGMELGLCQRYYEKSYDVGVAPGTITTNGVARVHGQASSNYLGVYVCFKQSKQRSNGTVTVYNSGSGAAGSWLADATTVPTLATAIGSGGMMINANNTTIGVNVFYSGHWTIETEL